MVEKSEYSLPLIERMNERPTEMEWETRLWTLNTEWDVCWKNKSEKQFLFNFRIGLLEAFTFISKVNRWTWNVVYIRRRSANCLSMLLFDCFVRARMNSPKCKKSSKMAHKNIRCTPIYLYPRTGLNFVISFFVFFISFACLLCSDVVPNKWALFML